jgi:hypothetical protein
MECRARVRYRLVMRSTLASIAIALLAACGSSNSGKTPDGNAGGGDGGGGDGSRGGPATVTVTLVNHPDTPATFSFVAAYQDGGGAWQAAPAPTVDAYTFTINSAAWGFAWTCIPTVAGGTKRVVLAYFSTGEKTALTETVPAECTDRLGTPVRLSGTVTNLPLVTQGGMTYVAYFADRKAVVSSGMVPGTGAFNMEVLPGTHDLVVGAVATTGGTGGGGSVDIKSAAIVRGVAVTGTTTAPAVDFSTAGNTNATVTVTADAGATVGAATTLYSAGATNVAFSAANLAPYESDGLGSAATIAGDVYDQAIAVSENGASAVVESWTTAIQAQTYVAPAALGGATASVPTSAPYPEIETTWNAYSNANGYVWDAQQSGVAVSATAAIEWTAVLGPGYTGASPKFQMPDLSGLTGWKAGWQFEAGTDVAGSVMAQTSSGGLGDFPAAPPAPAGTTRAFASSGWTVTP